MIPVIVPDTDSVASFVTHRVEKFMNQVKENAGKEADSFTKTTRDIFFKDLKNKLDLFGALRRFREDKFRQNYPSRHTDFSEIDTMLRSDQPLPGTEVVRISDIRTEFPPVYLVETKETDKGPITYLRAKSGSHTLPLLPTEYISRDLYENINKVFIRTKETYELKVLDASHDALLKAIERRRSMFKRVFGLALKVFSKESTITPVYKTQKVDFDVYLGNQTVTADIAFLAHVYSRNKDNTIFSELYEDGSQVTVVDTSSGIVYKDAKLTKNLGRMSFLYDRGRKGNTYIRDLTDTSLVFDPNVAKRIEKEAKATIRSFSGLFLDRLKVRIRQS